MTPARLEFEVRQLVGVVAAEVDDTAVTALLLPTADSAATAVLIEAICATAGVERTVRVIGGTTAAAGHRYLRAPVVIGSVAGVGVLAAMTAAAAVQGVLPPLSLTSPPPPQQKAAAAAPQPAKRAVRPGDRVIVPGPSPDWALAAGPTVLPDTPTPTTVPKRSRPRRGTPLAAPTVHGDTPAPVPTPTTSTTIVPPKPLPEPIVLAFTPPPTTTTTTPPPPPVVTPVVVPPVEHHDDGGGDPPHVDPPEPAGHPDNHGAEVSQAAHDHSHDAEAGNHGHAVSTVAHDR